MDGLGGALIATTTNAASAVMFTAVITAVTPNSGSYGGGKEVKITGVGFSQPVELSTQLALKVNLLKFIKKFCRNSKRVVYVAIRNAKLLLNNRL